MTEFVYTSAARCRTCAGRAVIPTAEIAQRFVAKSEGRLLAIRCPAAPGWHLTYPTVELVKHTFA